MKGIVPSLSALRAFEAAARTRSFTRAAVELALTQGAISQQIKGLEALLGVQLFVRQRGHVQLTDAAERYLGTVRRSIDDLAQATEDLVHADNDRVLTISSLATFTFRFIVPRLSAFRAIHPDLALRISATASPEEFDRKPFDVAVRLGHGDWPGMRVDPLFEDRVFPVCSPALLAFHALHRPVDLRRHTLLRSGFSFLIADAWPAWLQAAGIHDLEPRDQVSFEFAYAALEAATYGLGVALGREPFVHEQIRTGQLIKPFNIEVPSGRSYFLVSPIENASRPKVKKFREWIMAHFKA